MARRNTWAEGELTKYAVVAGLGAAKGDFIVTKWHQGQRRFEIPLFIDSLQGWLSYGSQGKWYCKEASAERIVWSATSSDRKGNVWVRYYDPKHRDHHEWDDRRGVPGVREEKHRSCSSGSQANALAQSTDSAQWISRVGEALRADRAWSKHVRSASPRTNVGSSDASTDTGDATPASPSRERAIEAEPQSQEVSGGGAGRWSRRLRRTNDAAQNTVETSAESLAAKEATLASTADNITTTPGNEGASMRQWTRHLHAPDRNSECNVGYYWWRHRSGRWFREGDADWQRYRVPDEHPQHGRIYLWNKLTDEFFYIDTGNQH